MATLSLMLRPATPRDLAAVDRLVARSFPRLLRADYPPSAMVLAVPLLARARPELLASGRYYVAERPGGGLIGAGGWSLRRDGRVAEVRQIATEPGVARRGIGREIMAQILAEARAAGAARIFALSTLTAVPFYRAMGFDAGAEVEIALAPGIGFRTVRMDRGL